MNDVNNRIFREFTMFLGDTGKKSPELSVSLAYEITIKSTICTALMTLDSEGILKGRYWNHLRVQRKDVYKRQDEISAFRMGVPNDLSGHTGKFIKMP